MRDTASAAVMGAIAGYLLHRYWPEIESVARLLASGHVASGFHILLGLK